MYGGVSVQKITEKASEKGKKPSHLWREAYAEHEATKAHSKCVNLEKQQRTLHAFAMKPPEDSLKNRLKVAYHTTKQATSEVAYEKTILLIKELCQCGIQSAEPCILRQHEANVR